MTRRLFIATLMTASTAAVTAAVRDVFKGSVW
jgi:hypothetical protein